MKRQQDIYITVFLLLVVFGFWLYGLRWLHIRPDEHLVYQHTTGTLIDTIVYQATRDVQAPLWHSFFWNWRTLTGDSEFTGRYQGILWSMLTLSLVWLYAKTTFAAARFGWFAISFIATNSYFFSYAFEIRPYPLVMLASVLFGWTLTRWLNVPSWRNTLWHGLVLAVMAYIHYFMAFWVLAGWLYALSQRKTHQHIQKLAAAGLIGLAIWSPWLPVFIRQVIALRRIDGTIGIGSTATPTNFESITALMERATNGLPWLVFVILGIGLLLVHKRHYGLLLAWSVGAPAISLTVNQFASVYELRYVSYASVGVGVGVGVVIAALPSKWVRLPVFAALITIMLWQLPPNLPDRLPYRTIYQQVSAQSKPGDALFFDRAGQNDDYVRWIMEQYLAPHLLENVVLAAYQAPPYRRIWHISGEFYDPHIQQPFYEVERTRPLTTVIGGCESWCYFAQLLEGAPNETPIVFQADNGDILPFYGAETQITENQLLVKLWWMPESKLEQDYSVSVRLVNEDHQIVIQQDAPPTQQNGNIQQTTTLTPNRMMLDYRTLSLSPSTLIPGEYRVQMVVYHPLKGDVLHTNQNSPLTVKTISIP